MSRYGTYDLKYGFIPFEDCPEPHTNADRIRSMSDEELAYWLASYVLNLDGAMLDISYSAWYKWLRREAK